MNQVISKTLNGGLVEGMKRNDMCKMMAATTRLSFDPIRPVE